ncbi:MAG: hypothetical protein ICV87_05290 [Gemmatimonadetes bacterium]|nr:hypothetical protein [Gemmatimonadota bacterium]
MHKHIPAALAALLAATPATSLLAQADATGTSYGRFTVHVVGDSAQRNPTLVTRQGGGLLQFLCSADAPVVVFGGAGALGGGTVPVQVAYDGGAAGGILLARVLSTGRSAVLPQEQGGEIIEAARRASSMVVRVTTADGQVEHSFALDGLREGLAVLPCVSPTASGAEAASAPGNEAAPRRRRDVITQEELAEANAPNVLQAIERLRHPWLRAPGAVVQFYVGGQRYTAAMVRALSVDAVRSIRYLDGPQASVRFGINHQSGAILIEVK